MNQASSQARQSLHQFQHLALHLFDHARGALEALVLLVFLAIAVWLLFPRSWDDVAGRSLAQSTLLSAITFVSALALVRSTLLSGAMGSKVRRVLQPISPGRALIGFVVSVLLAGLITLSPWSWTRLLFPILFLSTTVLPAATIISYIARKLHVTLDLPRACGFLAYGLLIAVALASLVETGANELLHAAAVFVVQRLAGQEGRLTFELMLQGDSVMTGGSSTWLIAWIVSSLTLLQGLILAPLVEETAKASAVLFPRLRLDRSGAFIGGMCAGLGFAIAESLMRETLVSGSLTLLLLRGGAGIVHALATGLVSLGVYELIHGDRRSALAHTLAGMCVHAVWNLAASIPSIVNLLLSVVSPDGTVTDASAVLPGFNYVWLGSMGLLMLLLGSVAIRFAAGIRPGLPRTLLPHPLSLHLDAVGGLHKHERLALASMVALTVALISASFVDLSASADTYHKSFIAERYNNARESLVNGDYEHAIQHLEAIRRVSPPNPQLDQAIEVTRSRYLLLSQEYDEGKRLYDQERWQEAVRYFDRILALEPRFKDVQQLREKALSHVGGVQ